MTNHEHYMQIALNLAHRGLGNTAPNPAVGCVIVKDDAIIGRGVTAPGGRPHAEPQALAQAGKNAKGATAYVTLEPCAHFGKTPPCAQSLIEAKIEHVVIALTDPNPKVNGGGIRMLEKAGITITMGILEQEARKANIGFLLNMNAKRPMVTLKLGLSSDGRISTPEGQDSWITGDVAKRYAHILRKEYDAILVGTGTVKADNPSLTCRLQGLEHTSPMRVVLGTLEHRNYHVFDDQATTWLVNQEDGDIRQDPRNIKTLLTTLCESNITRLLVEGGTKVAQTFLETQFVDRIILIQSTQIRGDSNAVDMLSVISSYKDQFSCHSERRLGDDILHIWTDRKESLNDYSPL
jgi:diaminohydroxyphosphoribosylaminopyrimidine deaminase/5-amino-6-(5-phosphoribosylamino)uracil reductase